MDKAFIGSIVRSKCGRDRKRVFMIVGVCNDAESRVLLCDGELHPMSKPKKKSLSHITVLAAADEKTTSFLKGCTDMELKSYLCDFEEMRDRR